MKVYFSHLLVLCLALGMLLSACSSTAAKLDASEWQLTEMNVKSLPDDIVITLSFKDGQAGGRGACNSYGAGYTQKGAELTLEPIAATEMYCEGLMDYETEYFSALGMVKTFELRDNLLLLQDNSGAAVLVFGKPQ